MRIAHVTRQFLPTSQTFIYTQLQAQEDLEQCVVAQRRVNADAYPWPSTWQLPASLRRLERLGLDPFRRLLVHPVRRFGADVLHAHFGWRGLDALRAARQLRIPLLTAFHGRDVYSPRHRPGGADGLYDALFEHGAAFSCVGPRARDELVRHGCPPERVHVVPVGLDLRAFPFAPAPREERLRIVQVARLVAKKGVDTAIQAVAAARSRLPDAELVIVGDGPDRDRLERLAAEAGVADRVDFRGPLPPAEVRELIGTAHIGLQPSRVGPDGDREGSPTVILEMQARGVDVIATDHADIPFIVPEPRRLVPEGDAEALADALVRRATLSSGDRTLSLRAGRALVERQHDAQRIARLLRSLYTTIAGG